jgi:hypothetical protein
MKAYAAQLRLLGVFVVFFFVQIVLLAVCRAANAIGPKEVTDLILQLLTIYSVPLSVIIAGVFAKKHHPSKLDAIFYTGVIVAILWNSLFAWRTIALTMAAFGVGEDRVKAYSEYIESVSKASGFLISGLLAYYFAKFPEGDGE